MTINGAQNGRETGTFSVKAGLAQMLKGGVIMDVVTAEQAKIAEDAGACSVMALERVPADIRADGGVARMSDPEMIEAIMKAVTIPVMAKVRIGHFVEAKILEAIGIDYIDESEVLTPADEEHHVWKHDFKVPFVCGCRDLGEALRRIGEGAAMIRTKGEAGTGDVVEAVRHMRTVMKQIRRTQGMGDDELTAYAKEIGASVDLLLEVKRLGRLPVVNFAAGGSRNARRRRADDALGRGRRIRGVWDFQVRRPVGASEGDRQVRYSLQRPAGDSRSFEGLGRADGRHQRPLSGSRAGASHKGLVAPPAER